MRICFTRRKKGKPDTLTCNRDDGSSTWESSKVGIPHDLLHYAVETTLGYRNAFYGLVAGGRDIASFGTKNGMKDVYTEEAQWVEFIVGLLQWPAVGGGPPIPDAEFFTSLEGYAKEHGLTAPSITPSQLAEMRAKARELHCQWAELEEGGVLELPF